MSWKLAAAAVTLRDQVNKRYPRRDKASDGTKGDDRHARRRSDHNPDKTGYVMALDIDEDFGAPGTSRVFADQLVEYMRTSGDRRIKNIVYEGRVASGTYPDVKGRRPTWWVWRSAPRLGHHHHIHISFAEPAKRDGSPFPLPVLEGAPLVPAKKTPAKKAPAKKTPQRRRPRSHDRDAHDGDRLLVAVIGLVTLVIRGQAKAQRPNGGKSQYDLLLRIEGRLDRLERNQDEHLRHHIEGA
jgi:hypothetical protein